MNGAVPERTWYLKRPMDISICKGSNRNRRISRLHMFLFMFPPAQLELIVVETNHCLRLASDRETTKGEIIKFFGIILLMNSRTEKNYGI